MITVSLPPGTYSHHAPTSIAAAQSQALNKVEHDRMRILAELAKIGPMTDEELETYTGIKGNALRPRRCSLTVDLYVVDTLQRRANRSGSTAKLWKITDAGRAALMGMKP